MARIKNNPLLKGLSGMLGDVVVYRETNGRMTMSNRPKKRSQLTEHQKSTKSKFLQAVQYAKGQMKDPEAKAAYAAAKTDTLISAYGVALADYLKGPEIVSVDVDGYTGARGQTIEIVAIDNFIVTNVSVEIRSGANQLIETGEAKVADDNVLQWHYVSTKSLENLSSAKIIVRAKDKPGNVAEMVHSFPPGV